MEKYREECADEFGLDLVEGLPFHGHTLHIVPVGTHPGSE